MSMDDILKLLVESRQQGQTQPSSQGSDPMTDLIGGLIGGGMQGGGNQQSDAMSGILGSLLGGGQPQTGGSSQQSNPMAGMLGSLLGGGGQPQMGGQQSGLSGMMSLLEMFTNAGGQGGLGQSPMMSSNPLMGLLQPLVEPLARKLKIPPELAMIVVSFVVQKLLAHHPTSGRDSTQFDLDELFNQVGSGKLDPNMLQNSGMVNELSRLTGMDEAAAAKSLDTAFTMIGQRALGSASVSTRPSSASQGAKGKAVAKSKKTR